MLKSLKSGALALVAMLCAPLAAYAACPTQPTYTTLSGLDAASATKTMQMLNGGAGFLATPLLQGWNGTSAVPLTADANCNLQVSIPGSVLVTGTFWQTTQPVSVLQLPSALGQTTKANSLPVTIASDAHYDVATTITRPANVTAYTAGDVLGGALDLGVLGSSGASVAITWAQLEADISAIPTGMSSFRLYLYNVTPPSALADNAAWDLPSGDRASFLGYIELGSLADLGSTAYAEISTGGKPVALSGTHLFGYLVTNGGFTPAANSEVYKLTLHTVDQ